MFGTESTENLYFSVSASQLGSGLDEQLQNFVREHPDTELIIIDTLQKVREVGGDSYSYANDYDIIARLKQFADNSSVCLMLVHHTRKQKSDDPYDMISGTNGLPHISVKCSFGYIAIDVHFLVCIALFDDKILALKHTSICQQYVKITDECTRKNIALMVVVIIM